MLNYYEIIMKVSYFKVQLASIDLLIVLVSELILVVKDNGKAYATYINDLFLRCKVQKVVLHSLIASVHDMQQSPKATSSSFTEDILSFNEVSENFSEAFQVQTLKLLLALVMLEQVVVHHSSSTGRKSTATSGPGLNNKVLRYLSEHPIPDQPMFLAAIVAALKVS